MSEVFNINYIEPEQLIDGNAVFIVVPGDNGGVLVRGIYEVSKRGKGRLVLKPIKYKEDIKHE